MNKQTLMPKYSNSIVTSKSGVNFVKTVVESAGCIFHQIDQENDLGIDAIIELVKDGVPLNKQFAAQIKSGQLFYNGQSNQCLIPVGTHYGKSMVIYDQWAHMTMLLYQFILPLLFPLT
ncbi:MAG: DUF4365 domain-containing protein [Deltaproteobacteria bacterium]|nr:DUF4365 domain-containing protein [Deltaproteobacteria bacterium]